MKLFLQTSFLILLTTSLSSCGSYIVSAAQLKDLHNEDAVPIGSYSQNDFHMKLEDGGAFSDKICLSDNNQKVTGEVYFIPIMDATLAVISDISYVEGENNRPIQGDLIYYVKSTSNKFLIYDPITNAVDSGNEVPFVTECENSPAGGKITLSNYKMQSFCLHKSVKIEQLSDWFSSNPLGENLAELSPLSGINYPMICK